MAEETTTSIAARPAFLLRAACLVALSILAACAESTNAAVPAATTGQSSVTASDPAPAPVVDEAIVVGVFPFLPPGRIDEIYGPLILRMIDELERVVHLRTAASFDAFSARLAEFDYDVALVQPFDHPGLIAQGYQPIARVEEHLVATIVALPGLEVESDFSALDDLRIGTPPLGSAMRLLVEAEILAAGMDPETMDITDYSTHPECLEQLLLDVIDVCATGPVPLREFERDFGSQLTVVVQSRPIASIAFLAEPTLDAETVAELRAFLLGLDEDPDAAPILGSVGTARYVAIEADDYDAVQSLLDGASE